MSLLRDLRALIQNLPRAQRRLLLPTLLCTIMMSLLEVVGVGAVVPLVTALTTPNLLEHYPGLLRWVPSGLQQDRVGLALLATGAFGAVFVFKNIFIVFATYLQTKLLSELQQGLSIRLFGRYLQQPYLFHVGHSSPELINRMTQGVGQVVNNLLKPSLDLLVEILTLSMIVMLVVSINPGLSMLGMLIIAAAAMLFHRYTKSRIRALGQESIGIGENTYQSIQQALIGIKDVRIRGREAYFHDAYAVPATRNARVSQVIGVLTAMPRLIIETATVLALLVVVAVMAMQGSLETLAPSLALFAAAAFRIMPSINRITMAMGSLQFGAVAVKRVLEDLELPESSWQEVEPMPFRHELRLSQVDFAYPASPRPILNRVDLVVRKGESIGFIGKTGAGKSTLIDLILGLLPADHGDILVDGVSIRGQERAWQRNIGYVPQTIILNDDTLRANIAFGVEPPDIDEQALRRAVTAAQLDEVVAQLDEGLDTRIGERGIRLSGGQKQRVGIARALYSNPDMLVLDEATSALDNETEHEVMRVTQSLHGQKTQLIIAHRTTTLMHCDRIVLMKHGRIDSIGTPAELAALYPRLFPAVAIS